MRQLVDYYKDQFGKSGLINLDYFNERSNIKGEWSDILSWKAPAGDAYLLQSDKPLNILIPARETINHSGGEETHQLNHRVTKSYSLIPQQEAYADSEDHEVDFIDYNNNLINVEGPEEENLDLYYLLGEGVVRIVYQPPVGLGSAERILFDKSIASVNSVDQFNREGRLELDRAWIVWEKHLLKVKVKTDADVAFPSLKYPELGQLDIKYRSSPIAELPTEVANELSQAVTRIS